MASGEAWFGSAILEHARVNPEAPAILAPHVELTFARLQRAIEGVAAALHGRGLVPGQPVGLVLGAQVADLVLLHACLRLGAPVLVLSSGDSAAVVRGLIDAAKVRLVVSAGISLPGGIAVPALQMEASWLATDPAGLPPPPEPSAPCYLARSSGTTFGIPKLVASTHEIEVARVTRTLTRFPLAPGDRYLAIVAFHFGFGRTGGQRSLLRGAAVVLPPPLRTAADLVDAVRRYRITWTAMTPTHLNRLLAERSSEGRLLPGTRILVSTAPLSPAERRAVMERISDQIYIMYASNEVGAITLAGPEDIRRNPMGAGRPDPGVDLEVVDDEERPCPVGTIGNIRVRRPGFPAGYQRTVPGAASRFAGGWFYPGDVGLIDAGGQLVVRGRGDDMMNVGGQKAYPVDIEECLARHPAVVEAAAVGVPDAALGTAPVAAVVLRAPASEADLLVHCRDILGRSRSPRRIVVVDAIPRTAIGKVDRLALGAVVGGPMRPV